MTRILDGEWGRQFELWDSERLRRQAMLFEAALAGEMQANEVGRTEIADLRGAVESITAALEAARAEAAGARADANADVASARQAVERADDRTGRAPRPDRRDHRVAGLAGRDPLPPDPGVVLRSVAPDRGMSLPGAP